MTHQLSGFNFKADRNEKKWGKKRVGEGTNILDELKVIGCGSYEITGKV